MITIDFIPQTRQEMLDKLGHCRQNGPFSYLIYYRQDIPRPVQYSVLLHELRHALDPKKTNRELRALWAQAFLGVLGFLGACWVKLWRK